ncbi:flavocytochrome c [Treponema lecithinolyticum]
MKHFQKLAIALLVVCAAAFTACSGSGKNALKDGVYMQSSGGHNGLVTLKTVVKDGKITDITTVESSETKGLGQEAINLLCRSMTENNSIRVDSVTGATVSSNCVKRIMQETLKQAGASDKAIQAMPEVRARPLADKTSYDYDVVIVGAGGAGLTAAITAKQNGASVVILEKNGFAGGNTMVSGGGLNVAGSDLQQKKGIADSTEKFTEDTLKGGDNKNNPALVGIMARSSVAAYNWLRDDIGVPFIQERVQQFGGHSVPRACIPVGNTGYTITDALLKKCEQMGIDIFYQTKAVKLVKENDSVSAVEAENGGKTVTFKANKGVVLATGGFGANVAMRTKYNSAYGEEYKTTCIQAAQGDGIVMALDIGAKLVDMDYIQVYPTCNPLTGIISYVANSRFDGAVLVNKEGHRFTNEGGRRDVISQAILAQTGKCAYLVWGSEIESVGNMTQIHSKEFEQMKEMKLIVQADSLEDAAKEAGLDVQAFLAEIAEYNSFVDGKKDPKYQKTGAFRKIENGPFYIQTVTPSTHHTMGGVAIDESTRVQSEAGGTIGNLCAAGEVVGGIHGTNRLGGNAITDVVVFGRIAGKTVSQN